MKKILGIIVMVLLCNTIAQSLFFGGIPYTWTLGGNAIRDGKEQYYQVNDSIKIAIIKETVGGANYDRYVIFECQNGEYKQTSADSFVSMFSNKLGMLMYMRKEYNRYRYNKPVF